ncbi:MAG: fumarylacetoacetate hydrolase family protein [Candidatus Dormibacteraceae bacterium]
MRRARFVAGGRLQVGEPFEPGRLRTDAGRVFDETEVQFLPPTEPTKVIALALNYADHAAELEVAEPEEPALFFKSPNTWVGHRAPVVHPDGVQYMHYEVELAVAIGRQCRRVPAERALDQVGGYTIANDLVVRDFVTNTFRPPLRGKCWDTFCPLGPYLVSGEIGDPQALALRAYVNDELRQEGSTRDMVRSVAELIEYISFFMTLEPGDLLLTGTPKGVSHIHPGDRMRLEVEGLGTLENPVITGAQAR